MSVPLLDVHRGRQLQSVGTTLLRIGLAFLLALFGTFKDVVLLGAALHVAGTSAVAARTSRSGAEALPAAPA